MGHQISTMSLEDGGKMKIQNFHDDLKKNGNGQLGRIGSGNQDNLGDSPTELGTALPFVDLFPTSAPTKNPTSSPTRPIPTKIQHLIQFKLQQQVSLVQINILFLVVLFNHLICIC